VIDLERLALDELGRVWQGYAGGSLPAPAAGRPRADGPIEPCYSMGLGDGVQHVKPPDTWPWPQGSPFPVSQPAR